MTTTDATPAPSMRDPSEGGGLREVLQHRYLLRLLVRKEVSVRYQGTVLGMTWSYIQPAMRFVVYFVIIGIVLQLNRSVPNFAVHIVSGIVLVHFFGESLGSITRSVVKNKSLVRKVGLPRELFPVSALLVSLVNAFPMVVILAIVAVATGWHPTWHLVPSAVLAFTVVGVWSFGIGLLFSAFNVYYRDFGKVVMVITTLLPWSTPMIYAYEMVASRFAEHRWALEIYLANPVAESVMLFQQAFWIPTVDNDPLNAEQSKALIMPEHLYERGLVMVAIGLVVVWFAQKAFTRLEASFAEQL